MTWRALVAHARKGMGLVWAGVFFWPGHYMGFHPVELTGAKQMIDNIIARAHHCAAGAKGASKRRSWPSRTKEDANAAIECPTV